MACATEALPVAPQAPSGNRVTFPSQVEMAAQRSIRIRPIASFGICGPLQPQPG